MNKFIETERLIIRRFILSDSGFVLQLMNSPGWLEYIGDRNIKTLEDAEAYLLNGPIQSYEANGFGLSLVMMKAGAIPIGACGLLKRDFLDHPDIGFAFLSEYMCKGIGFESAAAIISHAKNELNIKRVLAFTVPHNVASIKLLEKLGFYFEKIFTMPEEEEELLLFNNEILKVET